MRGKKSKKIQRGKEILTAVLLISLLTNILPTEFVFAMTQTEEVNPVEKGGIEGEQTPEQQTPSERKEWNEEKTVVKEPEKKETKKYEEGKIIVLFRNGTFEKKENDVQKAAATIAQQHQMTLTDLYKFDNSQNKSEKNNRESVRINTQTKEEQLVVGVLETKNRTTKQMLRQIKNEPDVLMAEPNYICTTAETSENTRRKYQWALENMGQNGGTAGNDLHINSLWNKIEENPAEKKDNEKVIAVVDTGIDYTNPEFADKMWENPYQGVLPGEHGYDFANEDDDPMDDNGHGTHCTGIITSTEKRQSENNQNVKIMALKFLNKNGEGDTMLAIKAYQYIYDAIQLGIQVSVVNNSWSGGYSKILTEIVNKVGKENAVSVFAAGNDATNIDTISPKDEAIEETAVVDSPYAVTVAATNEKGELAQFSNYGKNSVDLAAPGCNILSTVVNPVFNPGIYDDGVRKRLCYEYRSYEEGFLPFYDKQEDGSLQARTEQIGYPQKVEVRKNLKTNRNEVQMKVDVTEDEFFGMAGGKSLRVSVNGAKKGDTIYVTIPYTLAQNQQSDAAISFQTKVIEESTEKTTDVDVAYFYYLDAEEAEGKIDDGMIMESENMVLKQQSGAAGQSWTHITQKNSRNTSDAIKKKTMIVQIICQHDGDYTFYMDDFGVTKGERDEQEWYGTYEFESGTSMAAPYVTGIVANMQQLVSDITVEERINILKSCVTTTPKLLEKTTCGGNVDLRGMEHPIPILHEVEVTQKNQLHITGYGFQPKETTVKINGEILQAEIKNTAEIYTDVSGYKNHKVQISIETPYGNCEKTCFLVHGKKSYQKSQKLQWDDLDELGTMRVASDGIYIYIYNESSESIFQLALKNNKVKIVNELALGGTEEREEEESSWQYHIVSNLVSLNDSMYALLSVRKGEGAYQKIQLISLKSNKNELYYEKMGELPGEYKNRSDMTLGAYNGKLYLIGGYDYGKKELSTKVLVAEDASKKNIKWKEAPSLPSGRAAGECIQSGKNLYYALGAAKAEKNVCPKMLVFNGKKWKEEGAIIQPLVKTTQTYQQQKYDVYRGNLGICKEGILFTGVPCDGLGDTFYYNSSTKSYRPTEYNCIEKIDEETFAGSVVENYLIGISKKDGEVSLCSLKVKSGSYRVTAGKKGKGTIKISKKKAIPGEKVTIVLTPKKGNKISEFQINGKDIKGSKKTIYATTNVKVHVVFAKTKNK